MRYKETAKVKLEGFWKVAILATIIYVLIQSVPSGLNAFGNRPNAFGSIISLLVLPITIGYHRIFLLHARDEVADIDNLFDGFINGRYLINLLTLLLMSIKIVLWSLLLIIPGIIKAFAYAMTPFILADDEFKDVEYDQAIQLSIKMMDGHKLDLFMLGLSFILWGLLVAITAGIAILYVGPYMQATFTEFYLDIKQRA